MQPKFGKKIALCLLCLTSLVSLCSAQEGRTGTINWSKVQTERTNRHNQTRKENNLTGYIYNEKLGGTAQNRANFLAKNNVTIHKRKASDGYYNYNSIKERFAQQKIIFPKKTSFAFTENIARNYYSCTKKDCTEDFLKAIKKGYSFFLSEKNKSYKPHYKAIIAPGFTQVGVGIGRNEKTKKYFLVSHYSVNF